MEVNIHEAKTNLSRLIRQAEAGEEVIIARAGKPAVRLVPVDVPTSKLYKPGALKGRLDISVDFLAPDTGANEEMARLFNSSPILSHDVSIW